MLQDLSYGRLENEFENRNPQAGDAVICIRKNEILLKQREAEFPRCEQVRGWTDNPGWKPWGEQEVRYVFRLHGVNYFLWMGASGEPKDPSFAYDPIRKLRQQLPRELCYVAMTAWHLYCWYRNNRFCGCCGERTVHDEQERMVRCTDCGNLIYPRISPAVIVGVTDGDKILLTKYAGRGFTHYALIAGYTEIGETMEQTVRREVMEEVGLRVKNIRYYKSQPWGIDGNVLMGFYCDLDGEAVIHLDEKELSVAQWHHRGAIPAKDDGFSLTREMIQVFSEGREPR